MWLAWIEYRRGKRTCPAVREFEVQLEENLLGLRDELVDGSYQHGGYCKFLVRDPKQRIISAPLVRDHVVHQAIYNMLNPFFEKVFLPFSFSCRKNKGTHKAVAFVHKYDRQVSRNYHEDCWVLHGDIKKCFDSINHQILMKLLVKRIHCDRTLELLKKIIQSYHVQSVSYQDTEQHGIPLGNLTSQLFINVYLHELDFFVKEKLLVKQYIRYADDFILLFKDSEECARLANVIRVFLKTNLKLEFPSTHEKISRLANGIESLGVKFLPFYRKVKYGTFKRSEHLFSDRCLDYAQKAIDVNPLNASWQSLKGLLKHGHNIKLVDSLLNKANLYV